MYHQNISYKCFIKMSHKNFSSECIIKMSHQNVSSKCLIKYLIKFLMGKFLVLPPKNLQNNAFFLDLWKKNWLYIELVHSFMMVLHYNKKESTHTSKIIFLPLLGFCCFLKYFYCVFYFFGKINFSQSPKLFAQV